MDSVKIGDRVRPAFNGEDPRGLLRWREMVGVVSGTWQDCGETRVEVRWLRRSPYPRVLPAYLLERA